MSRTRSSPAKIAIHVSRCLDESRAAFAAATARERAQIAPRLALHAQLETAFEGPCVTREPTKTTDKSHATRVPATAMTLDSILTRLEIWLAAHRPGYLRKLARPRSLRAIDELPRQLRSLYLWHDGQTDPSYALVGRAWLLSVREVEIRRRTNAALARELGLGAWWNDDWFPFLDDGTGALVCADRESGALVSYRRDRSMREFVAPSVDALFAALVEGFESGVLAVRAQARHGPEPMSDTAWQRIRLQHGLALPLAWSNDALAAFETGRARGS